MPCPRLKGSELPLRTLDPAPQWADLWGAGKASAPTKRAR
eukprot:CAMPEP_0175681288 /NCGR_PEP_ID=MMETSP0097-20121207/25224_1 /TAXON_ID=311494 /ORGANISM="Alexandrium monilatum, Strain CCMP3105" /LENGTH=39 /DNA_ID= /DNA_START= /DNA_END= /DNA_ORIENTATION=